MGIVIAIGVVLLILVGAGTALWYNLRRFYAAESSAASEKALKDAVVAEAARIEQARLDALAADHSKDLIEATAAAAAPDTAFDFLRDSFPPRR